MEATTTEGDLAIRSDAELEILRKQIATLQERNARLEHRVRHDPMTELLWLKSPEVVTEWNDLWTKHGGTVIVLDIDGFKMLNDQYGHDTGDECIRAMGKHLALHCRDGEAAWGVPNAARNGGDEFVIFAPGVLDPSPLIERLDAALSDLKVSIKNCGEVILSVARGEFHAPAGMASFQTALVLADGAMYAHKHREREAEAKAA